MKKFLTIICVMTLCIISVFSYGCNKEDTPVLDENIYKNWMSYIKDDVHITDVVIPGSHNSATYDMMSLAECQRGDVKYQLEHGVRELDLRVSTDTDGVIKIAHAMVLGVPLSDVFDDIIAFLDENPSEFLIIGLRVYEDSSCHADKLDVDKVINKHLNPINYALNGVDVDKLTMKDIRDSGKRYMLINNKAEYTYSENVPFSDPWNTSVHGEKAPEFIERVFEHYDERAENGLFKLQTQQTFGLTVPVGMTSQIEMDRILSPYYPQIIEKIKTNESYLSKTNIISGDYMSYNVLYGDYYKCKLILPLNIDKNNVIDNKAKSFTYSLNAVGEKA